MRSHDYPDLDCRPGMAIPAINPGAAAGKKVNTQQNIDGDFLSAIEYVYTTLSLCIQHLYLAFSGREFLPAG